MMVCESLRMWRLRFGPSRGIIGVVESPGGWTEGERWHLPSGKSVI
jgi:hypothetical protein